MTDLRTIERESIRAFVQKAADEGYLSGRVLDYGCGKQPYRDIVEAAGGEYHGWDLTEFPANVSGENVTPEVPMGTRFDAVLCTQVLQYVPQVAGTLAAQYGMSPILVLTYPTNWPEVEPEDLHRFTKAGMERLLTEAGFEIVLHERRATIKPALPPNWEVAAYGAPDDFALGYGVIARA